MSQTLKKGYIDKKEKGSGEFQELYLEGIEYLQKLSGGIWTDYNEHDPGVTIFENIAYTLTNLSYKVDIPIIDILTESKGSTLKSGDNGFFIPSEILTTNPVIKEDYRKMLVDGVNNVKNVWMKTHNQDRYGAINHGEKMNLKGLYHIFVEMYDYDSDPDRLKSEEKHVKDRVRALFHAHRNLCEDLYQISILKPFFLEIRLNLSLDMEVDGEAVFAEIYYNINDFLSHEAKFESLWELKDQNEDINSIYTGPSLGNGFMKDKELYDRKNKIPLSEITKIISKVPGVISIDHFEMQKESELRNPFIGEITVPEETSPRLNIPQNSMKLSFKTADVELNPDIREIRKRYTSIQAENYGSFKTVSEAVNEVIIPKGNSLGVSTYHSIREQFPAIYGVGRFGLPKVNSDKRVAQVKQLKAYLLPFDQVMSNFLSQLTHIYCLYDVNDPDLQTYFYQELDDMPKLVNLIKRNNDNQKDSLSQWKDTLEQLNDQSDTSAIIRLNEVTDNLLARFAEEFPTYVLQKINTSCYGKNFTDHKFDEKLLSWKRKLISNYGNLSYNRARSFDYTKDHLAVSQKLKHTTPAIIEKIAILLGIHRPELRNLSAVVDKSEFRLELFLEDETVLFEEEVTIIKGIVRKIRDQVVFIRSKEINLDEALSAGVKAQNYKIEESGDYDKTFTLSLLLSNRKIRLYKADSNREIELAKHHAIRLLKKLNEKAEGIQLIEHLLLAPPVLGAHFGFSFNLITKKLAKEKDERLKFEQMALLPNDNRNGFVDFIKKNFERGDGIEFRSTGTDGDYAIEIFNRKNIPMARSSKRFNTLFQVNAHIQNLEDMQKMEDAVLLHQLKYYAYYGPDQKVNEAFFSFRMSFILPSWPVRFQQPSFRKQFSNILYQHAPIHIQYRSYWLELDEMREFEASYFPWLELLSSEKKVSEKMGVAYELIQNIRRHQKSEKN
jgi:hypothetical protein